MLETIAFACYGSLLVAGLILRLRGRRTEWGTDPFASIEQLEALAASLPTLDIGTLAPLAPPHGYMPLGALISGAPATVVGRAYNGSNTRVSPWPNGSNTVRR